MLPDVVRDDVVVPVSVTVGHDALREIGHRDVWVALHSAIGNHAIVPVVTALDLVVGERISRRHGEEVADTGVVVDCEGIAAQSAPIDLELPAAAREVVFPGIAGEQHAHTTIRIDTENRDIGVLIDLEVQPDAFPARINRGVAAVRPQLDAGPVQAGVPDRGCGHECQAEQRDVREHGASRPG